jgi:phosphoserine phosphatase
VGGYRHGSDSQLEAVERARSALQQGLAEAGWRNFADVWRVVLERGLADLSAERSFRRVYNGETLNPRAAAHQALATLGSLAPDPTAIADAFEQCWSRPSSDRSRKGGLRSNWFAVVPRQDGRLFASVDQVVITRQTTMMLSGDIVRVLPESRQEAGLKWHFRGVRGDDGSLYLTFWPVGPNNVVSTGVIYMGRDASRAESYEGSYVRREKVGGEFMTRIYGWYQAVPKTAWPRVALLDLDNTLRAGWSMRDWVEWLAGDGIPNADQCLERIDAAFQAFGEGALNHDELSNQTAQAYASMMKGKEQATVRELAEDFAAGEIGVHAFVAPLISRLESLTVAPIIVSGAPVELVSEYASILGVEEFFGLALGVDAKGRFDGSIVSNPGLASAKRRVTGEVRAQLRTVVLALGDSESDMPMLNTAGHRVVVGDLSSDPEWLPESVLRVDPEVTSAQELLAWLDARIDPDERFGTPGGLAGMLLEQQRLARPPR